MGNSPNIRLCRDDDFSAVVDLGDRFKRYLGLYPHKAISQAIDAGFVFGAFMGERLAGYALFALPYSDIRLVHLCVKSSNHLGSFERNVCVLKEERMAAGLTDPCWFLE